MAVYTHVDHGQLTRFLSGYAIGDLIAFEGILQGVENSNYRLQTTSGQYILTLYEKRVDEADLPFFVALMDHAAAGGVPVPASIADRQGQSIKRLNGRPACLIAHMPGDTIAQPTPDLAFKSGAALGQLHRALADFSMQRANSMGPAEWQRLAAICAPHIDKIAPEAAIDLLPEVERVLNLWPQDLPRSAIHADLFPDNVMTQNGMVSAIIDVYFACTDFRVYDIAVMHSAWCFCDNGGEGNGEDGAQFDVAISRELLRGYASVVALDVDEIAALPVLCQGASLRFFLSRAYDWLNTAQDAVVTRKDPLAYWRRLQFYSDPANADIFTGVLGNG